MNDGHLVEMQFSFKFLFQKYQNRFCMCEVNEEVEEVTNENLLRQRRC